MNKEEKNKCHAIIHSSATAAGVIGAGLAQLPTSDCLVLAPLQVGMTIALGSVFQMDISKSVAKATLASTTGTMVGRGISQIGVGWIPVLGNMVNAATAISVTECLGWSIAQYFSKGKR